jgi:hypothetical protein
LAAAIGRIDLTALTAALPPQTLVLTSTSDDARPSPVLPAVLSPDGRLTCESVADEPAWIERPIGHPLAGTVPVRVLHRIVEWLT